MMKPKKQIRGCLFRKKIRGTPSGQYYTQFRSKHILGGKVVQPTGTDDWNEANAILAQRAEEVSKGIDIKARAKHEGVSLRDVLDSYLEGLRTRGKKAIHTTAGRINTLIAHPVFNGLLAKQVTFEHGERYRSSRRQMLSKRRGTPIKEATIDAELGVLVSALNRAKNRGHIHRVPKIEMAHPKNKRQGWLSIAQFDKVLPHLCESMRLFFVIAYHAGCREGELLKTRWADVNLRDEDGYLQFREYETKNDKPRVIVFWGEMKKWVLWQKAIHDAECPDSPFIFFWHGSDRSHHSIVPGRKLSRNAVLSHWHRAVRDAHAEDSSILPDLIVHDLRRSACSNMLQVYKFSLPTTMEFSGHLSVETLLGYNIPCLANLKSAAREATKTLEQVREAMGNSRPRYSGE